MKGAPPFLTLIAKIPGCIIPIMTFLWLTLLVAQINPGFEFLLMPRTAQEALPHQYGTLALAGNPAGLATSSNGLLVSHHLWFLDSYTSVVGGKRGPWGFLLTYYNFGTFEFQDETPDDAGGPTFTPYAVELRIARGFSVDPETDAGLSVSFFHEKILDREFTQGYIGAGLIYRPRRAPGLSLAISVDALGLKKRVQQSEIRMPIRFLGDLTYQWRAWEITMVGIRIFGYQEPRVQALVRLLYHAPYGLTPWFLYASGRDLVPWQVGMTYQHKALSLDIGMSPSRYQLDSVYRVTLRIER